MNKSAQPSAVTLRHDTQPPRIPGECLRSLRAESYEEIAFRESLVAVGWDAVPDLSSCTARGQVRALVKAAYPFVERDSAESYTDQLFQFRAVMATGDLVLLLRRSRPDVAVGWLTGEYRHSVDLHEDIRHIRPVRWVRFDLPRSVVERDLPSLPPLTMVFEIGRGEVIDRIRALIDDDKSSTSQSRQRPAPVSRQELTPFAGLQRNLNYARSLATAGQHLAELEVGSFEVSDVFRAAWVQCVAALDHWVRQEVRTRMLTMAARSTQVHKPKGYSSFKIPLGQVERILQSQTTLVDVLDEHLTLSRGHLAYQHPDKIREAFSLVSDVKDIWVKVAKVLSERASEGIEMSGSGVRSQLAEIVRRRNKIAHEYDEDMSNQPTKRSIDSATVTQTIDWIEQLAAAVLLVLDSDE